MKKAVPGTRRPRGRSQEKECPYLGVGPGLVWNAIAKPVSPENQYGPQSEVCGTIKALPPSIYSKNPSRASARLAACC
jgi:hypothetical protein